MSHYGIVSRMHEKHRSFLIFFFIVLMRRFKILKTPLPSANLSVLHRADIAVLALTERGAKKAKMRTKNLLRGNGRAMLQNIRKEVKNQSVL